MTSFCYKRQKAGINPLVRGCVSLTAAATSQDILLVSCRLSVLSKLMHTWLCIAHRSTFWGTQLSQKALPRNWPLPPLKAECLKAKPVSL